MLTYVLLIYLAIGALTVMVFRRPIANKLWGLRFAVALEDKPGSLWRYYGLATSIHVLSALLFPLYLQAVYYDWKSRKPMTDAQFEEWDKLMSERNAKRKRIEVRKARVKMRNESRGDGKRIKPRNAVNLLRWQGGIWTAKARKAKPRFHRYIRKTSRCGCLGHRVVTTERFDQFLAREQNLKRVPDPL